MKKFFILLVYILINLLIYFYNSNIANSETIFKKNSDFKIIGTVASINVNSCTIKVKYTTNNYVNYYLKIENLDKTHIKQLKKRQLYLFTLRKNSLTYSLKNEIYMISIDKNKKIHILPYESDFKDEEKLINKAFSLKNKPTYVEYKQNNSNYIIIILIILILFTILLPQIMRNKYIKFVKE